LGVLPPFRRPPRHRDRGCRRHDYYCAAVYGNL
jgi:hypothetical protein